MSKQENQQKKEIAQLKEAEKKGGIAKFKTYLKLAGPGWLQSGLMLGGGSLAGSLYLGVLTGVSMIWLQPIAMILAVVMYGVLSYVVLSINESPFQAINRHINPVLGWSWALGALLSVMVVSMPQYTLAVGVLQQNLMPGLLGADGLLGDFNSRFIITLALFIIGTTVVWYYTKTGKAVKIFEGILKAMIYLIVACFIGVVVRLSMLPGGLDWSAILKGMIPNPSLLFWPAKSYYPLLEKVSAPFSLYWVDIIVTRQREVMIAVAAAAGGVNSTFFLAYSLLDRGWGKKHRGLAIFDISTGMFLPFALATTCVVIAASHQFHTKPQQGFISPGKGKEVVIKPSDDHVREFKELLRGRLLAANPSLDPSKMSENEFKQRVDEIPIEEKKLAATLLTRDAFDLSSSLEPLTGSLFANIIFGVGVLGMSLSTIIILMLISGMVICELLGREHSGWVMRFGSLAASTGMLGPFLWQEASFWLAIPTFVFGFILMPSTYFTVYLMMNKRDLMGSEMITGKTRMYLNIILLSVISGLSLVTIFVVWSHAGWWGIVSIIIFILAIIAGHYHTKSRESI